MKPKQINAHKNTHINRRKAPAVIIILLFLLLAASAVFLWYYVNSLAYGICRVEAGVEVHASDFLKEADPEAVFTSDSQPFTITVPGEYQVRVKSGFFTHSSTLIIQDTIPPEATVTALHLEIGETCEADAFVEQVSDATATSISYHQTPDFTQPGTQSVTISITDAGGNQTLLTTELFLSQILEQVTMEAGTGAPAPDQFVISAQTVRFVTDMDGIDYANVGTYTIEIEADGLLYTSLLQIIDTIPPIGQVQDLESYIGVPHEAADFVTEVSDATPVELRYETEPDLMQPGICPVAILLADAGGNTTTLTAQLTLIDDTEAPIITGAADRLVYKGDSISYRQGVKVTDNSLEELELVIDASAVNLNEEGVYPVTYTAADYAGNETTITINVTVRIPEYTEEQINTLADNVLLNLITAEMTPRDQVQAIYNWCVSHIAYVNHTEKGSWLEAAYMGLARGQGDCYVYASTAKALLTRAGITNMDIAKIPTRSTHYWNLVDIGDGWYHFDTTPRQNHPIIFMWTDADLMEYSKNNYNSHNYNHEQYPKVN